MAALTAVASDLTAEDVRQRHPEARYYFDGTEWVALRPEAVHLSDETIGKLATAIAEAVRGR